jgi:dynein heavy chain 1, cytosolic
VPELNTQLEAIFAKRLETLVQDWVREFVSFTNSEEDQDDSRFTYVTEEMRLELKSENNVFFLDPPLEHAKFTWIQEFHRIVGLICSLPRLESNKYEGSLTKKEKGKENYDNVLFKINPDVLEVAYRDIFKVFNDADDYIRNWYNYESLWVIDSKKIFEKLGDDINKWQGLLNEIRDNRKTFDNSQTEKVFGPVVIDYRLVLNKITTKYDSWHK